MCINYTSKLERGGGGRKGRKEGQSVLQEKGSLKSKVGSLSSMQTGIVPKAAMSVPESPPSIQKKGTSEGNLDL